MIQLQLDERLARSPYPAIRRLHGSVIDNEVIISGSVASYFLKQLAQETLMPILGSRSLRNRVVVESPQMELSAPPKEDYRSRGEPTELVADGGFLFDYTLAPYTDQHFGAARSAAHALHQSASFDSSSIFPIARRRAHRRRSRKNARDSPREFAQRLIESV